MPLLISTSINQKQRWLHNWNQGHWRPSIIIDIPWCMTQLECCTILENSRKNIFQFLSGDLQGRLPKIYLATFPWLFVFKVHVSKRIPKVPFHRPWWPDWYYQWHFVCYFAKIMLHCKSLETRNHVMRNFLTFCTFLASIKDKQKVQSVDDNFIMGPHGMILTNQIHQNHFETSKKTFWLHYLIFVRISNSCLLTVLPYHLTISVTNVINDSKIFFPTFANSLKLLPLNVVTILSSAPRRERVAKNGKWN